VKLNDALAVLNVKVTSEALITSPCAAVEVLSTVIDLFALPVTLSSCSGPIPRPVRLFDAAW